MDLPVLEGKITDKMYLKEIIASGSIGPHEITVSSIVGGIALLVSIKPEEGKSIHVIYSMSSKLEEIARQALASAGIEA